MLLTAWVVAQTHPVITVYAGYSQQEVHARLQQCCL